MWDFNQVVFQGRVTEDVELKETPNTKKPYCWFTVANNGPKKNPDGFLGEYTNFLNLTLFDEYAVRNVKKLWKGRRVLVIGKLIQNKWIDTRGGKHDELRIKVDRMIFDPMTPEEREKHGVVTNNPENNPPVPAPEENPFETAAAVPVQERTDYEKESDDWASTVAEDFGLNYIF